MTKFDSLKDHPDYEEIIQKLMEGEEARSVADWLKLKYPDKAHKHLCLSIKLLKDFQSSGYDQVYLRVKQSIQAVENGESLDPQLAKSLLNNKTFQDRVNEAVQEKVDLDRVFKEVEVTIRARMEQIFDTIQQNPERFKPDYVLIQYLDKLMLFIEKYDKYKNNRPDMVIQHNHTVAYVDHYTSAIQEAVLGTLREIDPEIALLCQEKLSEALSKLSAPPMPETPSTHQLLTEGQKLTSPYINGEII